eukprot:gb/GECH01000495.1/.p1 GENE.gb/GECH01000495.1/~~gb/GECH01000495.1/.p1  ORF type:complete len:101 (+),score=13.90 gb/GECH01000495.1/:1-303(+)
MKKKERAKNKKKIFFCKLVFFYSSLKIQSMITMLSKKSLLKRLPLRSTAHENPPHLWKYGPPRRVRSLPALIMVFFALPVGIPFAAFYFQQRKTGRWDSD